MRREGRRSGRVRRADSRCAGGGECWRNWRVGGSDVDVVVMESDDATGTVSREWRRYGALPGEGLPHYSASGDLTNKLALTWTGRSETRRGVAAISKAEVCYPDTLISTNTPARMPPLLQALYNCIQKSFKGLTQTRLSRANGKPFEEAKIASQGLLFPDPTADAATAGY